ncbi:MAG: Panacea domain-containing protein [Gammaproteobacteria bacterium]
MPLPRNSFDTDKAIELILYVASRLPAGKATFFTISKVLYFADLCHLDRYGQLISDDSYIAMKHGPMPSAIYNLMKKDSFRGIDKLSDGVFDLDGHTVIPRRDPDRDYLSESEIECLDEMLTKYGEMSFGSLSAASHKGAWNEADANDSIRLEDMVNMLPHRNELKQHIFGR